MKNWYGHFILVSNQGLGEYVQILKKKTVLVVSVSASQKRYSCDIQVRGLLPKTLSLIPLVTSARA